MSSSYGWEGIRVIENGSYSEIGPFTRRTDCTHSSVLSEIESRVSYRIGSNALFIFVLHEIAPGRDTAWKRVREDEDRVARRQKRDA